jgi:DNA-binding transcriptional MerR regulator
MDSHWAIGDLASAAGVTVRTLRHYEQIGLLATPERSNGLHRRYTDADVERLYRIVALRSLGLGLDAIATALDGTALDGTAPHLLEVMHRQLNQVEERIEQDQRLRQRLRAITAAVPTAGQPAAATLLDLMELI